ncbi:outer membrane protein transport protein [uncultured Desulfosarcina sp.]|uniref:OmpP1/FadL family transporter n=1 Tax=uncultured Desulfosarcina sp. TaxID=218289 RepID=UPI0029C7FFAE|nr:outer membrane protein transport protein [uncultured Desulfosarcina sp.]
MGVKAAVKANGLIMAMVWMLITAAPYAYAAFHEQLAIDTVAISLANTVTARPPGHMSIHYNPAGLSQLPDGKYFSNGLTIPIIEKTSSFKQDPDFEGFLGGYKNDPLDGMSGTSTSGRMYLPFYNDTIDFLFAPTLGISYRKPGSKWTFALGQYAPFAVGLVHGDNGDPAAFGGKSVYQQHLVYIAPAVSYQITPTLSVGLTVGLGQTAMGAEVDMRSPNDMVALTRVLGEATAGLEIPILSELTLPPPWFGGGISPYDQVGSLDLTMRDDFSPNYNVGILWEPLKWLAFGACYQSEIRTQLTGNYQFSYSEEWQRMVHWMGSSPLLVVTSAVLDLPMTPVASQSGTVTSQITFPQRVQLGIKIKPFSRLSLMADLHWANWSVLKEDKFVFDQDIQLLQLVKMLGYTGGNDTMVLTRNFEDTWHWSVGLEYDILDWLTFRCGYERRETSVQPELFDLMYALPDLENFGVGFGIKLKNDVTIDFAAGYVINESYEVPNNTSTNMNSTVFTNPVYNPYAGLDYEQKTVTYMGSFKLSMPTYVMAEMLHHQLEMVKHIFSYLNPFSKGHDDSAHK